MTWVEEMRRAAVDIAFPGWEHRDGDVLDVTTDYDPGGSGFEITVFVRRVEDERNLFRDYRGDGAVRLFHELMRRGEAG